jgi:hypothetical protein
MRSTATVSSKKTISCLIKISLVAVKVSRERNKAFRKLLSNPGEKKCQGYKLLATTEIEETDLKASNRVESIEVSDT